MNPDGFRAHMGVRGPVRRDDTIDDVPEFPENAGATPPAPRRWETNVDLYQAIALALEAIYDSDHEYGLSFWYRSVAKGGCTKTMLCQAFKHLAEHPDQFNW